MKKLFKNQLKLIRSLDSKKGRKESGLFIVESYKTVIELVGADIEIEYLVFDNEFDTKKANDIIKLLNNPDVYFTEEFDRISSLKNSEGVIAVAKIPKLKEIDDFIETKNSLLGLFDINDPGNLGTIIRTSLWYGVEGIILIGNTVDIYSPKVIRSSMGSLFKSEILIVKEYSDVKNNLEDFKKIGTFLDEDHDLESLQSSKFMLMLGNEANGLDVKLKKEIDHNFRIRSNTGFESLNVSIAAGIMMDRLFNS